MCPSKNVGVTILRLMNRSKYFPEIDARSK
jgi:hypothetical protein